MKYPTAVYLLSIAGTLAAPSSTPSDSITIPAKAPKEARQPLEHFLSYSIEFSSFANFAGNLSSPNTYSDNLLNSLAKYAGSKPLIRVGGNTQDLTFFNKSQSLATIQFFDPANPDYPANQTIGPAFFESYQTWPGVRFSHGFNLAEDSAEDRRALLDSVPYACKALRGRFNAWELGNEPDFYSLPISTPNPPRGPGWNETTYVAEWLEWSRKIRNTMQQTCPDLASQQNFKFFAPSFAGSAQLSVMTPLKAFEEGLNADQDINYIALHNYVAARGNPGITLQGTLLNHTNSRVVVRRLAGIAANITSLPGKLSPNAPVILGEGNSLARQGIGGVSNSFGAALWGLDFGLQLIVQGIERWHMHQGTNYRYQSWQPIETRNTTKGTKAPFYGNVALTAFLGDLTNAKARPQVVDLALPRSDESAYASYVKGKLAKIVVINMREYNATTSIGGAVDSSARPAETYSFQLPKGCNGGSLQRLLANGSDAITGVTFDGYSYAAELGNGKPVRLNNVTNGEHIQVGRDGKATVKVPRSSAVILDFD